MENFSFISLRSIISQKVEIKRNMSKIVYSIGKISTLHIKNISLIECHTFLVSFHYNTKFRYFTESCCEQSNSSIFDIKTKIIVYN